MSYACETVITGPYLDLCDCPDYGSSSCPLTVHYGECGYTEEELREIISFKYAIQKEQQ